MSSIEYHRVKIIPHPDEHDQPKVHHHNNNHYGDNSSARRASATTSSSSNKIPIAIQFSLHGLVPRQQATPAARTLFYCIASDQLFPTTEALSQVCSDPADFSRICAKFGRGGEVPRPDFVGGYTRALPIAQHHRDNNNNTTASADQQQDDDHITGVDHRQENNHNNLDNNNNNNREQNTTTRNSPPKNEENAVMTTARNTTTSRKNSPSRETATSTTSRQHQQHHQQSSSSSSDHKKKPPRWVFVAEARLMISEHILAALMGETTQQFIVLFTTAFFDRTSIGNDELLISKTNNSNGSNNNNKNDHNKVFSSNPESVFGQPLVRIKNGGGINNNNSSSNHVLKHRKEFDHIQTARSSSSSNAARPSSGKLAREDIVSFVELTPDLTETDLNVKCGPQDRSWLLRFASDKDDHNQHQHQNKANNKSNQQQTNDGEENNNNDKQQNQQQQPSSAILITGQRGKRRVRDPFLAAKQMCKHRMHLGDAEMLRDMAKKFNEFLIGSTQDCRRFCSFHAARMKIPIVFEQGMRSPQCQVFLQFLRSMRALVSKKCIPEPPPHLRDHMIAPSFLEEKPLVELIADLSIRFDQYRGKKKHGGSSKKHRNHNNNSDGIDWKVQHQNNNNHNSDAENEYDTDHDENSNEYSHTDNDDDEEIAGRHRRRLLPHEQQGYFGPEVRSVFAPWKIEWLDFLLLVCVETRLWREIRTLIDRFFELSDAQLLAHPEYNHEENAFRINLFSNATDIEQSTGYKLELSDAVKVANRCSHFCKASPANRALVFRIRHMTRVPYIQRILFDPKICMFEELCLRKSERVGFENLSSNNNNGKKTSASSVSSSASVTSSSATLGRILWCLLVPLKTQRHVSAVIGSRENGVPMVTTPKVAARQFRAFVLSSSIGDEAFKQLCKKKFNEWVQLIRERRIKKKQALQLQMSVRTSMVQNMDSRKAYFQRWMTHVVKLMKGRREGRIPPREVKPRPKLKVDVEEEQQNAAVKNGEVESEQNKKVEEVKKEQDKMLEEVDEL